MKILSIPAWLTVIIPAACLLIHPIYEPFGQSSTDVSEGKNRIPPEVNDGGSRFSQPRKNFDIDSDFMTT